MKLFCIIHCWLVLAIWWWWGWRYNHMNTQQRERLGRLMRLSLKRTRDEALIWPPDLTYPIKWRNP